jgi:Ring finger domain
MNETTTFPISGDMQHDNRRLVVVTFLCSGLMVFVVALARIYLDECYKQRSRDENQDDLQTDALPIRNCISQKQRRLLELDERYNQIESLLVSMFVVEHDKLCDILGAIALRNGRSTFGNESTAAQEKINDDKRLMRKLSGMNSFQSYDHDVEEQSSPASSCRLSDCAICLEPYRAGDIVSLSPQHILCSCNHTFHHSCIKEWLLQYNSCPTCRRIFLPHIATTSSLNFCHDDKISSDPSQNCDINEIANTDHISFYCIQHGIVNIPPDTKVNLRDIEITSLHAPTRNDLAALRGDFGKSPVTTIPTDVSTIHVTSFVPTHDDAITNSF